MNNEAYRKCFEICDNGREKRVGKKIDVHDYPAAVVACTSAWHLWDKAIKATSGKVVSNSYHKTPDLEKALVDNLGKVGSKRAECNNYIGACAEPHAAREVMKDIPGVTVDVLVFSYAFRPRTKTVIRYCRNCTDVFNVQNP